MNISTALDIAEQYATAIVAREEQRLHALRANTYTQDVFYRDEAHASPRAALNGEDLYHALFGTFPEGQFEVNNTVVGEWILKGLVLQEWTFTGTRSRTSEQKAPANHTSQEPPDSMVRLYGTSLYSIGDGEIQSETIGLNP